MATENTFPNRQVELTILQRLKNSFPEAVDIEEWEDEFPCFLQEIYYLYEHGVIEADFFKTMGNATPLPEEIKITKKGIDLLAGDGGLSAILDVVVIRLHDSTIKNLIEAKILSSTELSQPEKRKYIDQLRSLPADATKHVLLKLTEKGLENFPTVLTWISNLANQA